MITLNYTNLRRSKGILSRKCDLYFEGCFVEGWQILQNKMRYIKTRKIDRKFNLVAGWLMFTAIFKFLEV